MIDSIHKTFLRSVQDYIEKYPDVGAYVSDFVAAGIESSRNDANQRAEDFEIALSQSLKKPKKKQDIIIKKTIRKWGKSTVLDWTKYLEEVK